MVHEVGEAAPGGSEGAGGSVVGLHVEALAGAGIGPEREVAAPVGEEVDHGVGEDGGADEVAAEEHAVAAGEAAALGDLEELGVPRAEGVEVAAHAVDGGKVDGHGLQLPEADGEDIGFAHGGGGAVGHGDGVHEAAFRDADLPADDEAVVVLAPLGMVVGALDPGTERLSELTVSHHPAPFPITRRWVYCPIPGFLSP